ncbi:MAG: MFS transporter [Phycisphaerae bacterium]|nr:MFS transporter [Phycisphaerae bacterium]
MARSGSGVIRLPWPDSLLSWSMHAVPFPFSPIQLCSALFIVGAMLGTADVLCFVGVPETRGRANPNPPSLRELLGTPLRDRQFVRFLVYYSVFHIGSPGTSYYIWNNTSKHLGLSDFGVQIMLAVVPVLGELMFAPVWGRLINRVGRKTVMMVSMAYLVILPVCWLLVLPQYWWMGFVVSSLGNVCWNGSDQCNLHWLLHMASGEKGSSSYQAVFALAVAITGTMSGLLLGAMASLGSGIHWNVGPYHFNYLLLVFAVASAVRGIAYLFLLPRLHDDAHRQPVGQALRYVLVMVSEAIDTTVSLPLRLLGIPRKPDDPDQKD